MRRPLSFILHLIAILWLVAFLIVIGISQSNANNALPTKIFSNNNLQSQAGAKLLLKDKVVINHDQVRLSDIFYNVPRQLDQILMAAPPPGQSMSLQHSWLKKLSDKLGLGWEPLSRHANISITRAGVKFDQRHIEESLAGYFRQIKSQYDDDIDISLNGQNIELYLEKNTPLSAEVTSWSFDRKSERFNAELAIPSRQQAQHHIMVSGFVTEMITIPVPTRRIMRGTILTRDDFEMVSFAKNRLNKDRLVRDLDELVGRQARHQMAKGRPISPKAVIDEQLVNKGDQVVIVLKTEAMQLRAMGKALETGARGDIIQVRNNQTKVNIDARIIANGQVAVDMNPIMSQMAIEG